CLFTGVTVAGGASSAAKRRSSSSTFRCNILLRASTAARSVTNFAIVASVSGPCSLADPSSSRLNLSSRAHLYNVGLDTPRTSRQSCSMLGFSGDHGELLHSWYFARASAICSGVYLFPAMSRKVTDQEQNGQRNFIDWAFPIG